MWGTLKEDPYRRGTEHLGETSHAPTRLLTSRAGISEPRLTAAERIQEPITTASSVLRAGPQPDGLLGQMCLLAFSNPPAQPHQQSKPTSSPTQRAGQGAYSPDGQRAAFITPLASPLHKASLKSRQTGRKACNQRQKAPVNQNAGMPTSWHRHVSVCTAKSDNSLLCSGPSAGRGLPSEHPAPSPTKGLVPPGSRSSHGAPGAMWDLVGWGWVGSGRGPLPATTGSPRQLLCAPGLMSLANGCN